MKTFLLVVAAIVVGSSAAHAQQAPMIHSSASAISGCHPVTVYAESIVRPETSPFGRVDAWLILYNPLNARQQVEVVYVIDGETVNAITSLNMAPRERVKLALHDLLIRQDSLDPKSHYRTGRQITFSVEVHAQVFVSSALTMWFAPPQPLDGGNYPAADPAYSKAGMTARADTATVCH